MPTRVSVTLRLHAPRNCRHKNIRWEVGFRFTMVLSFLLKSIMIVRSVKPTRTTISGVQKLVPSLQSTVFYGKHIKPTTAFVVAHCSYRCILYQRSINQRIHHSSMSQSSSYLSVPKRRNFSYSKSYIIMMPEGPEIRTVVDQLQSGIGQRLLQFHFVSGRYSSSSLPDGYMNFQTTITPLSLVNNDTNDSNNNQNVDIITDWNCKGKFMYMLLDDGNKQNPSDSGIHVNNINKDEDYQRSIWITFGMTGKFLSESVVRQYELQEKECHVRWYIELYNIANQKNTKIYYSDVRSFGTLKFCTSRNQLYNKLQSLGPDLLQSCTETDFLSILQRQKDTVNICRLLMDQTKICGIGNYILAEGLYRANIDPFATISEISIPQRQMLYQELYSVIHESYQSQKNNSTFDYEYQCYGQTICKRRGNPVRKDVNGPHGRTIWYTDEQLFMTRQERQERLLNSQSVPIQDTSIPTSNKLLNNFAVQKNADVKVKMIQKRSNLDISQNDTPVPLVSQNNKETDVVRNENNIIDNQNTILTSTVATAQTPGNMKLAAILENSKKSATVGIATTGGKKTPVLPSTFDTTTLVASLLNGITDSGWKDALSEPLSTSDSFTELAKFLKEEELAGHTIYPPTNNIFTALNLCPLEHVKVIIIGQDPYHRYGQGHGLAFSVRRNVRPPPSLQNIFKELIDDIGIEEPRHGNLSSWAKQGVLLLNAILTVREGEAMSHTNKGWEDVTDLILRIVMERKCYQNNNNNNNGLVFLLWGNAAIKKIGSIIQQYDNKQNVSMMVIQSSHPSPLGAMKTKTPFLGSKCFSRANRALMDMGYDPIDWSVE